MRSYPIPFNEALRLSALHALPGADFSAEPALEKIADVARSLFGVPVGLVSLLDESLHYTKGAAGIDAVIVTRDMSFCSHVIMSDDPLVVPDTRLDQRFATHPTVVGSPHLRFYAAAPLILASGYRVGALSVVGLEPRGEVPAESVRLLVLLAEAAARVLERIPCSDAAGPPERQDGQSEFLSLIGHELRTPLTVLKGNLALLSARQQTDEPKRMVGAAQRSCDHLQELIETVIAFTDLGTGELTLNDVCHDPKDVVAEAVAMHRPVIESRGKAVRLAVTKEAAGPVQMDAAQIRLAVVALVENAMLHGGDEIAVDLSLSLERHLEIAVSDSGSLHGAVDAEELVRPFVVGAELNTRRVGGLGLGLPLVRKIAELHGGDFFFGERAGRTRATVRLPAWRVTFGAAAAESRRA